jgi:hypothetical protein
VRWDTVRLVPLSDRKEEVVSDATPTGLTSPVALHGFEDEEPSVKKGRHRRYEEARKFQRDTAAQFSVEDFDLDAPDPFSLSDDGERDDDEQYDDDVADRYDDYSDLAAKYADYDVNHGDTED